MISPIDTGPALVAPTRSDRGPRVPTPIDRLAELYLDDYLALNPIEATFLGASSGRDRLDDLSPAGVDRQLLLARQARSALGRLVPIDDVDRWTALSLAEHLDTTILRAERIGAGIDPAPLDVLVSPAQRIRDCFTLMDADSEGDLIAERLVQVPVALRGYQESLRRSARQGATPARRQVARVIEQCARQAGSESSFLALAPAGRDASRRAVDAARQAYAELGRYLRDELLAQAVERDGCGPERYAVESRAHLGTALDLTEAYEWALAEVAALHRERETVATEIASGGIDAAVARLDAEPRHQVGRGDFCSWVEDRTRDALTAIGGLFDLSPDDRSLTCRLAAPSGVGAYYSEAAQDGSRPAIVWWSLPEQPVVSTWRELTTVHHEGVPGHHLQAGHRPRGLNRWHQLISGPAGSGEGWALYAERLMVDLGRLDDPGHRLGYLDSRALRAARVVVDLGLHCGFARPAELGGGPWTYAAAAGFLAHHTRLPGPQLEFELDRYLGWPGQAAAYALGERCWLQLRDRERVRWGADFDLRAFHTAGLALGGLGLDALQTAFDPRRPPERHP